MATFQICIGPPAGQIPTLKSVEQWRVPQSTGAPIRTSPPVTTTAFFEVGKGLIIIIANQVVLKMPFSVLGPHCQSSGTHGTLMVEFSDGGLVARRDKIDFENRIYFFQKVEPHLAKVIANSSTIR
jgi:hypothetical protein